MNHHSRFVCLLATGLLCACGGAPSEGEIREAVIGQFKQQQAAMGNVVGKEMAKNFSTDVKGVHKLGCKADGEKAYRCDVEMEVQPPGMGPLKQAMNLRFVKASAGWQMTN